MGIFLSFPKNVTSWACFLGSEVNNIFQWKGQFENFSKLLFTWSVGTLIFFTGEKIDVSSAKSLVFDERFFDRSFM